MDKRGGDRKEEAREREGKNKKKTAEVSGMERRR
jgi:hypothetical protein